MNDHPLLIIKRTEPDEHYEVHYNDRVEFWSMDMKTKQGESKVEVYED
jgi:hypothetical protein